MEIKKKLLLEALFEYSLSIKTSKDQQIETVKNSYHCSKETHFDKETVLDSVEYIKLTSESNKYYLSILKIRHGICCLGHPCFLAFVRETTIKL